MTNKQRERAVAIAKDALRIIKLKGVIVKAHNGYVRTTAEMEEGANLQKLLPEIIKPTRPCMVCALGSLLLAHIDLYNKVKVPGYDDEIFDEDNEELGRDLCRDSLKNTFSDDQLQLIEECFEHNGGGALGRC